MKLEHIAPYLPYKLNVRMPKHQFKYGEQITLPLNGISISSEGKMIMEFLKPDDGLLFSNECERKCLPILRPLSDLTKSITHNGETFCPMDALNKEFQLGEEWWLDQPIEFPYFLFEILLKWHFDLFDLKAENECIYYSEIQ